MRHDEVACACGDYAVVGEQLHRAADDEEEF
jgi:hypothetical protein